MRAALLRDLAADPADHRAARRSAGRRWLAAPRRPDRRPLLRRAMQRLVIINYGSGNLHSAAKAFERAARESETDVSIEVTESPPAVASADRIVLPGVGAFADCKRGVDAVPGMLEALETSVRRHGRPFLGICVGAQLTAERGLEFRTTPGFGWIKGDVKVIEPDDPDLKIPHMGWNTLEVVNAHPLLDGIATGEDG